MCFMSCFSQKNFQIFYFEIFLHDYSLKKQFFNPFHSLKLWQVFSKHDKYHPSKPKIGSISIWRNHLND